MGHIAHTFCNIPVAVLKPEYLILKVTYDEETEEWNICRTSTLFYQIIKLRSVDFKFKLDTEFDEVYRVTPKELFIIFIFELKGLETNYKSWVVIGKCPHYIGLGHILRCKLTNLKTNITYLSEIENFSVPDLLI